MSLSLLYFNMVFRAYWESTLYRVLPHWSTVFRWEIFGKLCHNSGRLPYTVVTHFDINFQNSPVTTALPPPSRLFLVTFHQTKPTGRSASYDPTVPHISPAKISARATSVSARADTWSARDSTSDGRSQIFFRHPTLHSATVSDSLSKFIFTCGKLWSSSNKAFFTWFTWYFLSLGTHGYSS